MTLGDLFVVKWSATDGDLDSLILVTKDDFLLAAALASLLNHFLSNLQNSNYKQYLPTSLLSI